jgi:hypothetical protein
MSDWEGNCFDELLARACRERCSKMLASALDLEVETVELDDGRLSAERSLKEARHDSSMVPNAFQN